MTVYEILTPGGKVEGVSLSHPDWASDLSAKVEAAIKNSQTGDLEKYAEDEGGVLELCIVDYMLKKPDIKKDEEIAAVVKKYITDNEIQYGKMVDVHWRRRLSARELTPSEVDDWKAKGYEVRETFVQPEAK